MDSLRRCRVTRSIAKYFRAHVFSSLECLGNARCQSVQASGLADGVTFFQFEPVRR